MCLGEGVAPLRRRKTPLSGRSAAARPLRSGNSGRLLESLACPSVQVCPGRSGMPSHEKRHEGPGAPPPPPLVPHRRPPLPSHSRTFWSHGKRPLRDHRVSRGAGPSGSRPAAGCRGLLPLLAPPDLRVRFPHGAVSQPSCEPSEELTAFQGIFPGRWPHLTAWLFGQGCSRL